MRKRLIQVEDTTADELKRIGDMGETYDIVIKRLIKGWKEKAD